MPAAVQVMTSGNRWGSSARGGCTTAPDSIRVGEASAASASTTAGVSGQEKSCGDVGFCVRWQDGRVETRMRHSFFLCIVLRICSCVCLCECVCV